MAPRVKIQREEIVRAAVDLVRTEGADKLCARALAEKLGCSTQPVFSNFETMDELRLAVVCAADALCGKFIKEEVEKKDFPVYKASGMAYIRFAVEEKELFKLLYMRDRTGETEESSHKLTESMHEIVKGNTGLNDEKASLFHLEMWAFVHGIAVILATGFATFDRELVSRMLTDAYLGLKKHYGME